MNKVFSGVQKKLKNNILFCEPVMVISRIVKTPYTLKIKKYELK